MAIDLTVHEAGIGLCSLSGKEGEGMLVTFKDGTLCEGFLSHRAFQQLIKMRLKQLGKPAQSSATPALPSNGPVKS